MLRFSKRLMVTAVVIAGCLGCFGTARAQGWKQIGILPAGSSLRCAFFWDTAHGVVGGVNCIYTYRSGVWTPAIYPEPPGIIKSLRLLDGVNLYAAGGSTCIWKSTDSGATWQKTSTKLVNADDIYLDATGNIQGINLTGTGMMKGTSFARIRQAVCAIARDDQPSPVYSTDEGQDWHTASKGGISDDGYCMAADTCSGHLFTMGDDMKAELWESVDSGNSWVMVHDFVSSAHDVLEGANSGILYVQGIYNVYECIDRFPQALAVNNIGGPGWKGDDQRMFSFGQNNRYLVDPFDTAVWLWKGPLYPDPNVGIFIDSESDCSLKSVLVHLWYGDDSNYLHAYTKDGIVVTPSDTVVVGGQVLFSVTGPPGQETGTIYFHDSVSFGSCDAPAVGDTSIPFKLTAQPPKASLPSDVFDSACNSLRIPLLISPDVCDTGWIDSIVLSEPNNLYFTTTKLPAEFLPGTRDTIWLYLSPQAPGRYYAIVKIIGKYNTTASFDTTLYVTTTIANGTLPKFKILGKIPKVTACSPVRIPLLVEPVACDTFWIDSVQFEGKAGYSVENLLPSLLKPLEHDTLWIDVSQSTPGNYSGIVQLYGHSLWTLQSIDTFEALNYRVYAPSSSPRIAGSPESISGCREAIVPLILRALPCDSVQFTSCTLTVSGSPSFSQNLQFPRTLAAGKADTLLLNFPPQDLNGTYIITAHVTGKYLGSVATFDTTIQIRVTFTSSAGALIASDASVTLDTTSVCAEADTIVTLTNLGCDSITVTGDATTWLPGWSASDPQFPFPLAPDSSFTVRVHYIPSGPAWSQQSVTYNFKDIGGNSHTSSALVLNVTAISAPAKLLLSDTALALGTFSRCNASGDTTITLTNLGCDSLTISNASLTAGTGFTLLAGGDTVLAANQSATFQISFSDSLAGSYASALHIHTIGAHGGAELDTTIPVTASVIAGSRLAALSTQNIALDTTSICEELDSSITITNTGCEPDTITEITFANASFSSLPSLPSLPIIIQPNRKITIPLTTAADTTGHATTNTDTLMLSGNLDAPLAPVLLSRGLTYPSQFAMSLAAQASAPPGRTIPVYVLRTGTVPASANELDFALTYDDNLLSYIGALEPDIAMTDSQSLANGMTERSFAMKPASDRDTIAALDFESYLTKNEQTPITLSGQQFIAAGEISPPCIASLDTNSPIGNFTLELACGDSEMKSAMDGLPIQIKSMQVNSEHIDLTIARGDARYTTCTVQVLNVLGTQETERSLALQPTAEVSLPLGTLPDGIYYLRVASGGYVTTRRFMLVK